MATTIATELDRVLGSITSEIDTNTEDIATNEANIETNTAAIAANTAAIATNTTDISNLTARLDALSFYFVSGTAPTNTRLLWIDTTATTGGLKYYNGSEWVHVPVAYT